MIKRIVAAAFVTAITAVGLAAPADAAPQHLDGSSSFSIQRAIDWE